jgi:hypothetical protein
VAPPGSSLHMCVILCMYKHKTSVHLSGANNRRNASRLAMTGATDSTDAIWIDTAYLFICIYRRPSGPASAPCWPA